MYHSVTPGPFKQGHKQYMALPRGRLPASWRLGSVEWLGASTRPGTVTGFARQCSLRTREIAGRRRSLSRRREGLRSTRKGCCCCSHWHRTGTLLRPEEERCSGILLQSEERLGCRRKLGCHTAAAAGGRRRWGGLLPAEVGTAGQRRRTRRDGQEAGVACIYSQCASSESLSESVGAARLALRRPRAAPA
jgi:hypothetical protein